MLLVLIGNSYLFGCIIVVFEVPKIGLGLIGFKPNDGYYFTFWKRECFKRSF